MQQIKGLIAQNATVAQEQSVYTAEFERLNLIRIKLEEEIENLESKLLNIRSQRKQIDLFFKRLSQEDKIIEVFDEDLWLSLVRCLKIYKDKSMILVFKDGTEIKL